MKRFLLSLSVLLVSFPAFAEGRSYDEGGCSAEQSDAFCSMIGLGMVAFIVLVVVFAIWDNYKMKTDPAYRARAERFRREQEEERRQRGY